MRTNLGQQKGWKIGKLVRLHTKHGAGPYFVKPECHNCFLNLELEFLTPQSIWTATQPGLQKLKTPTKSIGTAENRLGDKFSLFHYFHYAIIFTGPVFLTAYVYTQQNPTFWVRTVLILIRVYILIQTHRHVQQNIQAIANYSKCKHASDSKRNLTCIRYVNYSESGRPLYKTDSQWVVFS